MAPALLYIPESLGLWNLMYCSIEVDVRLLGMFLVAASEYNYIVGTVGSLKCCAFRSRTVLLLCSVVI